jgi:uncharacterized protein YbjT (DUF2867 family)
MGAGDARRRRVLSRVLAGAAGLGAERVVADSGLPWTTLRATQFHELFLTVVTQMAKLPVIPVPVRFRFQPVAAAEVADQLTELALGSPKGLVPDIAGPKAYSTADLLRGYLSATHRRRPLLPVWLPGNAARSIRAGANLAPDRAVGRVAWEEFLADRVTPKQSGHE